MKLCALVVWFNPDSLGNAVERVKAYSQFLDKVYIVDNSETDNSSLASDISNAEYVPLMKNTGIAHALNAGLEKAFNDGFDYCMTMDQDSVWDAEEIQKYIKIVAEDGENYQAFCPVIRTRRYPSFLGKLKRKICRQQEPGSVWNAIQAVDRWITSGSFLSLKAYKAVPMYSSGGQGFNENFFIDEVDYEFCVRFVEKGFKCRICSEVYLNQTIGALEKVKGKIFPKWNAHSDFRLYYIVRNCTYMMKKYPEYTEKYRYKRDMKQRLFSRCIQSSGLKDFISFVKIVRKAKLDAKKMLR